MRKSDQEATPIADYQQIEEAQKNPFGRDRFGGNLGVTMTFSRRRPTAPSA